MTDENIKDAIKDIISVLNGIIYDLTLYPYVDDENSQFYIESWKADRYVKKLNDAVSKLYDSEEKKT